jgi:RNA polymerase sigma factor (sigma-70 family)
MRSRSNKSEAGSRTSVRLLRRLRAEPTDQAAWTEFAAHYSKMIYGWCRRWNLQHADAADVTQAVLLKVARKMRTFVYDPSRSFRGWLKTLTHHAWRDLVTQRRQRAAGEGEERLQSLEAREDPVVCAWSNPDHEVLASAMSRVRLRVKPHTWQAFRLSALEGLSGPEAAARLGVPLAAVYKAKSNVQKLLQEEVRRLERTRRP